MSDREPGSIFSLPQSEERGVTVMKVLRCTDIAHFYLPCGAPHGYPIGAQEDDYHWHSTDDDGNLFASYHAACKPPVPPLAG
jgi:hypothetical protein